MSIPILIIGKSGSGKSTSIRTLPPEKVALINVLGKPLPFRGKYDQIRTDDYGKIIGAIKMAKRAIIIIDDCGYLMTNQFMRGHASAGKGNGVFSLYNEIGDSFWNLVDFCRNLPGDKRVYFIMHEDESETGSVKPKSIGRMIDEKVCLEGMFTVCLRCMIQDGKHVFSTQSNGLDVAKSPIDMFATNTIPNDLAEVDKAICDYYEIGSKEETTNETH